MRALISLRIATLVAALCLSCADRALGAAYTITDLGNLGFQSFATGINNRGQVVGFSYLADRNTTRPFLYSDGVMTNLGSLGGTYSEATAINDLGEVVGTSALSVNPNLPIHAFSYLNGVMTDLNAGPGAPAPFKPTAVNNLGQIVAGEGFSILYSNGQVTQINGGGRYVVAKGINDLGQIVGFAYKAGDSGNHAFVYSNGVFQDLGLLGGTTGSVGSAINNLGQIAGAALGTGGASIGAILDTDGVVQNLTGGINYYAMALNNHGEVVGQFNFTPQYGHGFVYNNGQMNDLNDLIDPSLGWILSGAVGVNDSGQIVGTGLSPSGKTDAFLLTPVGASVPLQVHWPAIIGLFLAAIFARRGALAARQMARGT